MIFHFLGHVPFPSLLFSAASSPLPLPGKPAVLPSLPLALARALWPQHRGLPPLPSFSASAGAPAVPLSQQLPNPTHGKQELISDRARHHVWLGWGGHPHLLEYFSLGGMSLSAWESLECPSAWLWKFGPSQKRGLSESHTATPLVRSHLIPGSVESRQGPACSHGSPSPLCF